MLALAVIGVGLIDDGIDDSRGGGGFLGASVVMISREISGTLSIILKKRIILNIRRSGFYYSMLV